VEEIVTARRTSNTPNNAEGASAVVERVTVALIPKAGGDLQRLQDRTGLSKTDLINRAITLYEFIDEQQSTGHELLVRDGDSGEIQVIRLL
jgi:hypothetical protein